MKKTSRSHCSCSVATQCLAPNARPLLTMVRYMVWIVLFWHSKCSTQITCRPLLDHYKPCLHHWIFMHGSIIFTSVFLFSFLCSFHSLVKVNCQNKTNTHVGTSSKILMSQNSHSGESRFLKCSQRMNWKSHQGCGSNVMFCAHKIKRLTFANISTYLAMAIWFVLNDATRGTLSAFHQRCIDVIFNFVNRNIYDSPLLSTQLLAASNKVHFSCGN